VKQVGAPHRASANGWMSEREAMIVHEDVPPIEDIDLPVYLSVSVVFRTLCREEVRRVLARTP
jgi:hypothetical protein